MWYSSGVSLKSYAPKCFFLCFRELGSRQIWKKSDKFWKVHCFPENFSYFLSKCVWKKSFSSENVSAKCQYPSWKCVWTVFKICLWNVNISPEMCLIFFNCLKMLIFLLKFCLNCFQNLSAKCRYFSECFEDQCLILFIGISH